MFSNVGWGEILVILILGLIVIGPERLPGLIKEVRAVILAARTAVAQAREQLEEDFGDQIEEFRKPIQELNTVRQMGAKGFITRTLLDGDESFLTSLGETKNTVKETVESARILPPKGSVAQPGTSAATPLTPEQPGAAAEPAAPSVAAAAPTEGAPAAAPPATAASGDQPAFGTGPSVPVPQQADVGEPKA